MTSADEKIAQAIKDNGCPLTLAELEVETGLRLSAIQNGLKSLKEQRRLQTIRDGHTYLYRVTA